MSLCFTLCAVVVFFLNFKKGEILFGSELLHDIKTAKGEVNDVACAWRISVSGVAVGT